jgi:NitT/TauT family transport system ATP-binding protein
MTVVDNVQTVLQAAGLSRDVVTERAQSAIRLVGLAGFEEAYPRELSGGMKQRVGMARALAVEPEILFMDEPFSQVDALTAESLRAEVLDIWAAKQRSLSSILMVSHDIKEVAFMADRIVMETIILRMPQENYETAFETLIGWARFGDLFAYDETAEKVSAH